MMRNFWLCKVGLMAPPVRARMERCTGAKRPGLWQGLGHRGGYLPGAMCRAESEELGGQRLEGV